jgi:uncharacterized membrane-anchored protein
MPVRVLMVMGGLLLVQVLELAQAFLLFVPSARVCLFGFVSSIRSFLVSYICMYIMYVFSVFAFGEQRQVRLYRWI